jgi:phenylpropionate dioxygenase-like ring-hydroxylating dioxygenase large terminal subunit
MAERTDVDRVQLNREAEAEVRAPEEDVAEATGDDRLPGDDRPVATREPQFAKWPRYRRAALGFREHWYPVMWSSRLRSKPVGMTLLGEDIVFVRQGGAVYALHDRCPHRGIPLSMGKREFPGTISCIYHGWTYELASGRLVAALTDGPDSPIVGKVRVRTYPATERKSLVWVYVGDREPPPLEDDVPADFLADDAFLAGRHSVRAGNWRYAAENGFDESHSKMLHRDAAWMLFRFVPAYMRTHVEATDDGFVTRMVDKVGYETEYPGLGRWPHPRIWRLKRGKAVVSIRRPGTLRVQYKGWTHYEWYVPTDPDNHRYLQFVSKRTSAAGRVAMWARYWGYIRWVFHWRFNNQDRHMVELMPSRSHPERLFRPDVSITAWRKLCESDPGIETPDPREDAAGMPAPAAAALRIPPRGSA